MLYTTILLLTCLTLSTQAKQQPKKNQPSKEELEAMAAKVNAQMQSQKPAPPKLADHHVDFSSDDMWLKWSQAIGIKFGRAWKSLALDVPSHADRWCRGFAENFSQMDMKERQYQLTKEQLKDFITPLNGALRDERKRQDRLAAAADRPATLAKLRRDIDDAPDQNHKDAYQQNINRLEEADKFDAENPIATEPDVSAFEGADMEQYNYYIGHGWSSQFPSKWPLDTDAVCEFFKSALEDKTEMPFEESEYEAIMFYIKNGIQFEKKLQQQKDIAAAFMIKNGAKEGVVTTESGLEYEVLEKGLGPKPTADSYITYHARGGRHRGRAGIDTGGIPDGDGELGDNPVALSDNLSDLVDGLREGIQLMSIGAHYKFWIPSDLGFGDRFALLGQFYPHDVLAIEIKLESFSAKKPELPDEPQETKEEAERRQILEAQDCEADLQDDFRIEALMFKNNSVIPGRYSCEAGRGFNYSPGLRWFNAPEGTKSFVLWMVHTNHYSEKLFVHWLMYDIPSTTTSLRASDPGPDTAILGATSYGSDRAFYSGPCPQEGLERHFYQIELRALSVESVSGGERMLSLEEITDLVEKSTLASTTLMVNMEHGEGLSYMKERLLHKVEDDVVDLLKQREDRKKK